MRLKRSLALSGTEIKRTNMSKCIKYGIFSHICDRAIRGPKYYETNFGIFIYQDDQISCPPQPALQKQLLLFKDFITNNVNILM